MTPNAMLWAWSQSPMDSFKMLASRLAIISGKPKSVVLSELAQLASGEGKCESNPFQVAPILKLIEL